MTSGEDATFSPISGMTCRNPSMCLASASSCGASLSVILRPIIFDVWSRGKEKQVRISIYAYFSLAPCHQQANDQSIEAGPLA